MQEPDQVVGVQLDLIEMLSDPTAAFRLDGRLVASNAVWRTRFSGDSIQSVMLAHPAVDGLWKTASAGQAGMLDEVLDNGRTRQLWRVAGANQGLVILSVLVLDDPAFVAVNEARIVAEEVGEVNAALAIAADEDEILAAIAKFAERYNVVRSVLFYSAQGEGYSSETLGAVDIVAMRDGHGTPIPLSLVPIQRYTAEAFPLVGVLQKHPSEVIYIEDFADKRTGFSDGEVTMQQWGNDSGTILIPLRVVNVWQGILAFSFQGKNTFSPTMRRVLNEIRPIISAVVASRRLHVELEHSLEQMRATDKLKDEFLANMSHELRTPLNAIIGLSDLMLSEEGDHRLQGRVEDSVNRIYSAGQQLLSILNDVLDLSKIESGLFELSRDEQDLTALVMDVVGILRLPAKDKKITLVDNITALKRDLPMVYADDTRVRQVLMNLVGNAIKFSKAGTVTIDGRYNVDADLVEISIKDEGVGIAKQYHDLIFERFRQVEGNLARRRGGAGLGLPISRRLVELHGGQLWLESEMGHGSTFYFSLPTVKGNN